MNRLLISTFISLWGLTGYAKVSDLTCQVANFSGDYFILEGIPSYFSDNIQTPDNIVFTLKGTSIDDHLLFDASSENARHSHGSGADTQYLGEGVYLRKYLVPDANAAVWLKYRVYEMTEEGTPLTGTYLGWRIAYRKGDRLYDTRNVMQCYLPIYQD